MHELDINRGVKRGKGGLDTVQQHKLFARLLESEAGLGMLNSTDLDIPASYRRRIYDHSLNSSRKEKSNK